MVKLPIVSGKKLIKVLKEFGYEIVGRRGSHIRLKSSDRHRKPVTVPDHKEIGRGLLRKVLRNADIPPNDFKNLL